MHNSQLGKLLVASTVTKHPVYAGGVCLVVHQDDEQTIGVMLNRPLQPNIAAMTALMNAAALDAQESSDTDDEADEFSLEQNLEQNFDGSPDFDDSSETAESWQESDFDDGASLSNSQPPSSPNRIIGHLDPNNALETDSTGMTPLGQLHFGGPVSGPVVALHDSSDHAEMETSEGIYVAAQKDHLEELVRSRSECFRLIVGHLRWAPGALQSEIDAGLWHPIPATPEEVFAPAVGMWPRLVRRATSRSMAGWIGTTDLVDAASWN